MNEAIDYHGDRVSRHSWARETHYMVDPGGVLIW